MFNFTAAPLLVMLLVLGIHLSTQQSNTQDILRITIKYFDFLQKTHYNGPFLIADEANDLLIILDRMLELVGIDGDVPWILDTLHTIVTQKSLRIPNYVAKVGGLFDDYLHHKFLPAIRRAVEPFGCDAQIAAALQQYEQNYQQRTTSTQQSFANTLIVSSSFFANVSSVLLDINRRAVLHVQSGNEDLSAFEAEVIWYQSYLDDKAIDLAQSIDDAYDTLTLPFLQQFWQISTGLQRRYSELLHSIGDY